MDNGKRGGYAPGDVGDDPKTPRTPAGAPGEGGSGGQGELPRWNRARVKKKRAGGEDDAFQGGMRRAGRVVRHRAALVLGLGVLLVGGIVGGGYAFQAAKERRAAATRILAEAVAYEARGQVGDVEALWGRDRPSPVPIAADEEELDAKVSEAIERLSQEYPDSDANLDAELVRGARALRREDAKAAIEHFQTFLVRVPKDHPLRFLALEGLGIAREAAGDLEGALAAFRDLTGPKGSFYRDQGLAHQGRVLEGLGRTEEALRVYRTYAEEYPFSESSLALEYVRERLLALDPDFVPPKSPAERALAGAEEGDGAPEDPGR